jgi:hypothetical protein
MLGQLPLGSTLAMRPTAPSMIAFFHVFGEWMS